MRSPPQPERRVSAAPSSLPLPTLLAHVLVAFTIEFDNEAERQMPHRTTRHGTKNVRTAGSLRAPWLVSLVMWSNCMRFVGEEGVRVGELEKLARATTNLHGMERWGYIKVEPDPDDKRPKPPLSDWVIRATRAGKMAQNVWGPLFRVIEERWQTRFGKAEIDQLRKSLCKLITQIDLDLPDCLPILGYGLFSQVPDHKRRAPAGREGSVGFDLPLSALLSQVLLAFAIEFEREAELSLAICANVVRVLDEKGVRARDLPLLSGVSKEAINVSVGYLEKRRYLVIEPDPSAARTKLVRLTPKGREAQIAYRQRIHEIEDRWRTRFGEDTIRNLRESLERLVGEPTAQSSPLFRGLEPYPDGWRASVPKPSTLPHYPMVSHRGGYPDGS
jgi:DNA-binding MarR family transcriptional regulator